MGFLQARGELARVPWRATRVGVARYHEDRRVFGTVLDQLVRREAGHSTQLVRILRVPELHGAGGPAVGLAQATDDVHQGHLGNDGPPKVGSLRYGDACQKTTIRRAGDRQPVSSRDAACDQVLGDRVEIRVAVLLVLAPPVFPPLSSELRAAPQVGVDEEATGLDIRAPGFPAEMVDDEPEAPGAEVIPTGADRSAAPRGEDVAATQRTAT